MAKTKKSESVLDDEMKNALREIVALGKNKKVPAVRPTEPSAPVPPAEAEESAPAASESAEIPLLDLYRAMKPRTMCPLLWLLLFHWQARRTGGEIVLEDFAAQLGVKKEKVRAALSALAKSGRITVTHTTYGRRRAVVSRTIVVNGF